jgi:hypothetical protein
MKKIILAILLSFSLKGQIPDDVLHYYAGFLIGITAGHITFHYSTHERWDVSLGAAFASAAMAGYAKEEFYDGTLNKGTKSPVDFVATIHGGIGSIPVCCVSFNIHQRRKHPEIFEEDFEF